MSLYKKYIEQNVYEAAKERIKILYDRFDEIMVSFSGGKDSTVVLNLALEEAEKRNRLPLNVFVFDEEAIHPPTVEYLRRISKDPRLNFKWYCLPVRHRNACSRKQPWWYPWNPKKKHLWVREMPPEAITYLPGFKMGMTIAEAGNLVFNELKGSKMKLMGIRTSESLRRYNNLTRREEDSFYTLRSHQNKVYHGFPIYDWSSRDVWIPIFKFGWDYNRSYDVMQKYGMTAHQQRVCPPYGEEPLRNLDMYAACWPKLWNKMVSRVPGVNTAVRYANTDLYGINLQKTPNGETWQEYIEVALSLWGPKYRERMRKHINEEIKVHYYKSKLTLKEDEPDPVSGMSWKYLAKLALSGDMKDRLRGAASKHAMEKSAEMGFTFDGVLEKFGTEKYKKDYYAGNVGKDARN